MAWALFVQRCFRLGRAAPVTLLVWPQAWAWLTVVPADHLEQMARANCVWMFDYTAGLVCITALHVAASLLGACV